MKFRITLFFLICSFYSKAQNDTIFLNNKIIICEVKELTTDAVKFSYPKETLTNTIYKNTITSITFKNGRIQKFNESTSLKEVKNVNDYDNVSITKLENEVKGLFKLGEVSSKAVGTTVFSNQEQVKERAYKKLKIQASFQGGNIVYLTDLQSESLKSGFYSTSKAQTNLSGVLYTNFLPKYEDFISLINEKRSFKTIEENKLKNSSFDMKKSNIDKDFKISSIENQNGLILIVGKLKGAKSNKFRVVSYDKDYFNIYYESKRAKHNIKLKI